MTSEHDLVAYSTDATPLQRARPDAVVLAGTRDEIAGVLRLAEEHRFPVTPRASGTNLSGGAVPLNGGVVLSCARMRKLIEIDEQNLTATCEPGLQNALLQEAVAEQGPLLPARSRLAGDLDHRRQRHGVLGRPARAQVRHHARLRDRPRGRAHRRRVLRVGGKLTKDVAGYDLVRLLVGSRGHAGGAHRDHAQAAARPRGQGHRRRLLPRPRGLGALGQPHHRAPHPARHARVPRPGDDARGRRERRSRPADARPGRCSSSARTAPPRSVERDTEKMAEICREEGALSVEVAADEDAAGKLLAARRGAIPALARLAPTLILEDATVPRSELAAMVRDVQRIAEEEGLLIAVFGHAGDGNLHPTCCIDDRDPDQVARVHRAFDRIFEAALARGGTITGEHGIGVTKLQYLEKRLGPVGIDLLRGIKRAFDPLGLLNPGRRCRDARRGRAPDEDCSRTTCCAPASRAASASRPARPTRTRATRRPRRAAGINLMRALEAGTLRRGRRARGAVVLPRLPRLRAGLPGRRAVRHAAGAWPRRGRPGARSQAARPAAGRRHAAPHACSWAG